MTSDLLTTAAVPSSSNRNVGATGFIIGPVADSLLIIGAPLIGLVIGAPLFSLPDSTFAVTLRDKPVDLRQMFITVFINAHLFLVYFRSHANQKIFKLYPMRFIAVPLGIFALGAFSPVGLGLMGLVAVWWDVYHSSMQTFGFGRIYDSKQKNDASAGRRLDYWMNLLVYTGPVLAGAHFVDHIQISTEGVQFLAGRGGIMSELLVDRGPAALQSCQSYLAIVILLIGVPFVIYYLHAYDQLRRQKYQVSWQKVWLMIITSAVSIYSWGFRSFIDAFWVMNFFHALQYFAIVGYTEKRNLTELFRVKQFSFGSVLALVWVCSFCLLYGLWSGYFVSSTWAGSLVVTTSLMHFWYDGFIWSVKKKQV